jgi:hypothetical protein
MYKDKQAEEGEEAETAHLDQINRARLRGQQKGETLTERPRHRRRRRYRNERRRGRGCGLLWGPAESGLGSIGAHIAAPRLVAAEVAHLAYHL